MIQGLGNLRSPFAFDYVAIYVQKLPAVYFKLQSHRTQYTSKKEASIPLSDNTLFRQSLF